MCFTYFQDILNNGVIYNKKKTCEGKTCGAIYLIVVVVDKIDGDIIQTINRLYFALVGHERPEKRIYFIEWVTSCYKRALCSNLDPGGKTNAKVLCCMCANERRYESIFGFQNVQLENIINSQVLVKPLPLINSHLKPKFLESWCVMYPVTVKPI